MNKHLIWTPLVLFVFLALGLSGGAITTVVAQLGNTPPTDTNSGTTPTPATPDPTGSGPTDLDVDGDGVVTIEDIQAWMTLICKQTADGRLVVDAFSRFPTVLPDGTLLPPIEIGGECMETAHTPNTSTSVVLREGKLGLEGGGKTTYTGLDPAFLIGDLTATGPFVPGK